jgi:hypothetical protein
MCSSLAIEMEYLSPTLINAFAAWAVDGGIELMWNVFSDEGIKGYRIYRSAEGEAVNTVVNPEGLIPPAATKYIDDDVRSGKSYRYTLGVVQEDGYEVRSRTVTVQTTVQTLALHQNHPNPFNPATTISFALPERVRVNLSIYTLEGRLVKTLVDDALDEGIKEFEWDGTDASGNSVGSGVYFYRLKAGKRMLTKKMNLLK